MHSLYFINTTTWSSAPSTRPPPWQDRRAAALCWRYRSAAPRRARAARSARAALASSPGVESHSLREGWAGADSASAASDWDWSPCMHVRMYTRMFMQREDAACMLWHTIHVRCMCGAYGSRHGSVCYHMPPHATICCQMPPYATRCHQMPPYATRCH